MGARSHQRNENGPNRFFKGGWGSEDGRSGRRSAESRTKVTTVDEAGVDRKCHNLFFAGVKVLLFFFPGINDDITDWRGIKGFLVLKVGREVDAVVFADVFDGVRG